MDPVGTLRKPFRAPSGPSRGAVNNDHQSSPFVMNGSQRSVLPMNPIGHAVKKVKSNSGVSFGVVYRDGETTGYEEDGREEHDWVALHRAPNNAQHAIPAVRSQAMYHGMTPLGLKQRGTNETVAESSRAAELPRYYYTCCWRKPQTKKHKSWENDGVLKIIGDKASLYEQENSNFLSSGRLPTDGKYLVKEQEFKIGGKDIMIQEQISEDDYLSGKCFGSRSSAPAPTSKASASTMPTFAPMGFYGASSAPPKKFTAPSVTRPPAYSESIVGLPPPPPKFVGNVSKAAKRRQEDAAADLEGPDTRLQDMGSFSTKPYTSVGATDKTFRATRELGKRPDEPSSVWDPERPGAVVMKRPDEHVEKNLNPNGLPVVDVVLDPGIAHRLREHQKEGIRFMYECVMGMRSEGSGCILADEMGLGKTAQAIALAWTLLKQNPLYGDKKKTVIDLAVVVCPVTLVKNWKKEFNKWITSQIFVFGTDDKHPIKDFLQRRHHYQVLVIGYERLRSVVDELRKVKIGLLICDEGHRLKSAGAKTTKALRELDVDRRIILSGTPIQNELSEFHAMVDFVNPGLLDSYQSFKKIFEGPIMKARQPGCNANDRQLGQHRAEQLNDMTSPYILRRTSDVIAGYLPPKSEYVVFVAPTALQKTLYRQIVESSAVRSALDGGGKALTLIDLLKKLCNAPSLLMRQEEQEKANGELVKQLVDNLPPNSRAAGASMSGKMKAVEFMLKTLKEETDEKVVLVSSYVQTLNILQTMCNKNGYGYCRLDGSMKAEERQPSVDKFNKSSQDEQFVFLLSTKAGGTGLNIVGASRLVLFDSDWNPANDLQAMGRIHRDGQKRPCFIYRLLTAGTIDEKIFQRQITKIGLADSLMHGQQAGEGKSGKDGDAFTPQQLRALFTFSDDTPCETHDQLSCGCSSGAGIAAPPETADDEAEEDVPQITEIADDSDEDLPDVMQGFVQASQYKAPKAKAAQLTSAKDLAVLKEWTHVNCQTDNEDRADNIEDNVLRDMVLRSIGSLRMASSSRRGGYADSDDDEAEDLAPPPTALIPQDNGGDITFVFHKKVGALDDKSDESGDKSASTSGTPDGHESRHQSVER